MTSAFQELKSMGLKAKWSYPFGEVIPVSRDQNGRWFSCTKNGFHQEQERNFLPLGVLPSLRMRLSEFERRDAKLREFGGRVFVGKSGMYRRA